MNEFDVMDQLALQLRCDYNFYDKRIDIFDLAKKLRIKLIKYSSLSINQRDILENEFSIKDAFTIFNNKTIPKTTYLYYNDNQIRERIRFSMAHEIKHIICNESNPTSKDEMMAGHFARSLLVPSCILISENYQKASDVSRDFNISRQSAKYALKAAMNRFYFSKFQYSKLELEYIEKYEKMLLLQK